MKRMQSLLLSALVTAGTLGLFAAEASPSPGAVPAPTAIEASAEGASAVAAKPAKDPLKQLRGKLLYERSRIRKLERAAEAAHTDLAEQVHEMDNKREALYISFEPKLEERYANEKSLLSQIEAMAQKKK